MGIYFGNNTVDNLYIGLTPVTKGYVGTYLFYDGDDTIIDFTYEKYILDTQYSTLYNTEETPIKSAILKGNTKYRDIDTGDILDTFDETKNLELVSVKMPVLKSTGKNLFDGKLENGAIMTSTGSNTPSTDNVRSVGYIKVNPNASIVLSNDLNYSNKIIYEYDSNKDYIGRKYTNPFTTSTNCQYIRFRSDANQPNLDVKYQVEYSTTEPTSYEPYKSNILTVNEEVELRRIGEGQDTLDLMTGEVVERIGEVIFDGSVDENWYLWATYPEESAIFGLSKEDSLKLMKEFDKTGVFKCDKFSTVLTASLINLGDTYPHAISFFGSDGNYIQLRVYKSLLKSIDVAGLREYLTNEPITVQYQLATESVKTVDLSVVDQDGNNTELSTFNDITHVTLSSEGLIPEAELEVATKNEEVLNTMSLEMDDISTTQNALQETSDTQSENVDATMMATTEIYEQLL